MSTIRTYWSGNKRLISDLLWCFVITLSIGCFDRFENGKNPFTLMPTEIWDVLLVFLERVLDVFFFFFFWSWKDHHIQSRRVKYVIKGLFYCLMFSLIKPFLTGVFFQLNWMALVLVLYGLVVWKYVRLMGKANVEKSDSELEDPSRISSKENK
jgi:hypothetical protein